MGLDGEMVDDGAGAAATPSSVLLLAFSVAMFLGAFGAGYLPMVCQLSSSRMRQITTFGAGLLVGTALVVIVPEGMEMWYAAKLAAAAVASAAEEEGESSHHDHGHDEHEHEHGHHGHVHLEGSWQIGMALAVGFAFMFIVDHITGGFGHGGHSHSGSEDTSGSGSSDDLPTISSSPTSKSGDVAPSNSTAAMLGLMVHAAVDGVALGATTFAGGSSASLLIFFAIMLHKAPAAFGLTSFLLQDKHPQRVVRSQLLIFSLAAPVGAVCTYYGMQLNLLGYEQTTLAIVMLFSGGTFLFVASVHILPEVMAQGGPLSRNEVALVVFGTVFPVFINLNHGH